MKTNKRFSIMGIWFLINLLVNIWIKLRINPELVMEYGYILSVFISTAIIMVVGVIFIRIHDYYKIDLLEKFKKSRGDEKHIYNKTEKFIMKWEKKGSWVLFLALTLGDSIVAVIYYREGFYRFNGLPTWKIKGLFFLSVFTINAYFNAGIYTGISIGRYLLTLF